MRNRLAPVISIHAAQVTAEILSLFDLSKPTMPRAFNVLEGVTRGQILVEDSAHPSWAVVQEAVFGTLYIGGQLNATLLESLVHQFQQTGEVGIGCWLDDPLNDVLPADPDYDGRTLYFTERSHTTAQTYLLPEGYSLAERDRDLLRQSFEYESTIRSFGTEAAVLEHTRGTDILHDGKVVCEAATGAPTHGRIEIGIETAESHRRRGLATIACALLIERCERQGYRPWWDCAKQNIASAHLARKLGFCNEREYRYVWWRGFPPVS